MWGFFGLTEAERGRLEFSRFSTVDMSCLGRAVCLWKMGVKGRTPAVLYMRGGRSRHAKPRRSNSRKRVDAINH